MTCRPAQTIFPVLGGNCCDWPWIYHWSAVNQVTYGSCTFKVVYYYCKCFIKWCHCTTGTYNNVWKNKWHMGVYYISYTYLLMFHWYIDSFCQNMILNLKYWFSVPKEWSELSWAHPILRASELTKLSNFQNLSLAWQTHHRNRSWAFS